MISLLLMLGVLFAGSVPVTDGVRLQGYDDLVLPGSNVFIRAKLEKDGILGTHPDWKGQWVQFLLDGADSADFYLTQIVSHHEIEPVARFLEEADRRGLALPGVFGVFHYRSASRKTFKMLSSFIRVPEEQLTLDFKERGLSADEICARSVRGLRAVGVRHVYLSNLRPDGTPRRLATIERLVEAG